MRYDEDTLVQAATAEYLRDKLGWESVYAYNTERFGKEGSLGRKDETEVILTRYLGEALGRACRRRRTKRLFVRLLKRP